MRVISKKKIREFSLMHPQAEKPLMEWYKKTKAAAWKNIADVKLTFPHADAVGTCTVFNVGGNKY
jgi:mRNA interferase HigB